MSDETLTDAGARGLRRYWFTYLDTVEALQPPLHAYCLKLSGNVWDAEDLVQDTLLKGFAMTARGDFHGPDSPVRDARAYLFRTATNLWLDGVRRRRWQVPLGDEPEAAAPDADPAATADALSRAAALTSGREFAALLLKDVYAFTLEEIADFVGTTVGTVKSALSRARSKLRTSDETPTVDPATAELARAFADAMNARDTDRILALLSETVKIDVCNVGGGRGRSGEWTDKTQSRNRFEYAEYDGAPVVLLLRGDDRALSGIVRVEAAGGAITRVVDYHYAPDTIRQVAEGLGLECHDRGYHQSPATLVDMIATTGLPWRASG